MKEYDDAIIVDYTYNKIDGSTYYDNITTIIVRYNSSLDNSITLIDR